MGIQFLKEFDSICHTKTTLKLEPERDQHGKIIERRESDEVKVVYCYECPRTEKLKGFMEVLLHCRNSRNYGGNVVKQAMTEWGESKTSQERANFHYELQGINTEGNSADDNFAALLGLRAGDDKSVVSGITSWDKMIKAMRA